jgi:Uma2 family endonuclease
MRRKRKTDLPSDPPPELVIEVDITRSSLNRFPIFAGIGVAEIWRYHDDRVHFYALEGTGYRTIEDSVVLSAMTASQATIFLKLGGQATAAERDRAVREWIRNY